MGLSLVKRSNPDDRTHNKVIVLVATLPKECCIGYYQDWPVLISRFLLIFGSCRQLYSIHTAKPTKQ